MGKAWAEEVKEILDSFDKRRDEITKTLNALQGELKTTYSNIVVRAALVDKQKLIWRVKVADFLFDISEEEVREYEEQTLEDVDENNNQVISKTKIELKEAVQNIIIDKLRAF